MHDIRVARCFFEKSRACPIAPARRPIAAFTRRLNHYTTRGLLESNEIGCCYPFYHAHSTLSPFPGRPLSVTFLNATTTLIDRLVCHADILTIEGDSYRRRVAEAKAKGEPPASES